jgi:serine/threonine-protein kinase
MKPFAGLVVLGIGVLTASVFGADNKPLAIRARDVLKERCHGCHKGPNSKGGNFNALVYETLVTAGPGHAKPVIVPGKLAQSRVWQQLDAGEMPEEGSDQREKFTPAEKEDLKHWIEAGAPKWPPYEEPAKRPFLSIAQTLIYIRDDLRSANDLDREYLRYYTLTHLYNQPAEQVSDADLELYRAALSKAINSLSWEKAIVIPQAIDKEAKTIFRIDLRDLEWEKNNLWGKILACYPYGLSHDTYPEAGSDAYKEIVQKSKTELPFIRADWFVATASRPPLYHDLLQLPKTATELETRLGVDIPRNFYQGRLMRAGFARSKISPQANRLVERHDAHYGAYWKSYDFRAGAPRSQLALYPLGPKFDGNPFAKQAFEQAGGEIIFNLPNGLQGYYLVNGAGNRLDSAPTTIVSDPRRISGAPDVVTGLSCIACHADGIKTDFKDSVGKGTPIGNAGGALDKIKQLYPPPAALVAKMSQDRRMFLEAQYKAVSPFLALDPDPEKAFNNVPEPVGRVNEYYRLTRLSAASAAAELGLPDGQSLIISINANPRLTELGLGPLAVGGDINRADWETTDEGNSIFQRAAQELRLGTPLKL